MQPTIVVVEDEEAIVTMLKYNLEQEGYKVFSANDGEEGLALINERMPALVVLDWMMPGMSGIEVCRQLRRSQKTRNIPVIMLSARGEEEDKIRGLDYGADDYMTKPFSPSELIARIKAVFRRIRPALAEKSVNYSDVVMDLAGHHVTRKGMDVHLGPTEFRLLQYMMEHPGRVFSREQLLDAVWGHDIYVELRTVDVHIRRLRKALAVEDGLPDIIRTVRSAGYALEENNEGASDL